jgi:hypothetical protein
MKTFAQWVIALTRGYIKATGKKPDKLAKLKINMEAGQKVRDQEKILTPDFGKNKPWYKVEGELTYNDKIDWLVKNVDQNPVNLDQQAIPPKETLEAMLKDGRGDLIDHFFEMHTKKLGGKPQINIDTSDLKHPELVEKMMTDKKLKPTLVKTEAQIKKELEKQNKESIKRFKDKMKDPEDFAGGGIAGMLGEPTYADDIHRVPYQTGERVLPKEKPFQGLFHTEVGGPVITKDDSEFESVVDRWSQFAKQKGEGPEDAKRNKIFALENIVRIGREQDYEDDEIKEIILRTNKADGGRIGFGLGGFEKARRLFLKTMGAGAVGVGAAKSGLFGLLKGSKSAVVKDLTSVPIKAGVDGMPSWFKPLVNKVIKEGDDVTGKFATGERQIVHKTNLPHSDTDVIVTQNLDTGNVSVDIGIAKHDFQAGHLGQPARLEYKAAEDIVPDLKTGKGGGKTKEEFWVEEAEFTGGHPENIKFEESTFEKFGDHGSNFDEVEKFATGKIKKKTAKESLKAERAHWTPEGDYASGGRVPLAGGKKALTKEQLEEMLNVKKPKHYKESPLAIPDNWLKNWLKEKFSKAEGGRVPFAGGAIVKGGKWFIKSLTDTRKQLKTMRLSPGQLKQYLDQIDDQIRRIKAGEKIPDEVIQTIRKDPKFKSVWQNQLSANPELREMEEVLLEYGQKNASGGLAHMLGE